MLCELLPKRIALKKADTLAFASSGVVLLASRIFAPVVWLLTKATNGILRMIRISTETAAEEITEEEIRLMIDVGSAKGAIKEGEKEILNNVFEFDNKSAAEVMTHRRDTVLLRPEDSDDEWEKTITENDHNFFPVCGKNHEDITGVLRARDYFGLVSRQRETVMAQAVRPAQLVPTTVRTDVLFRRMKKNRNHFAVVLDEHGGMMGIVTMKDLLEELVGDLDDDITNPPERPLIEKTGPDTWAVNGAVSLDRAARELDVELPVDRYETFGGYVFSILGRIPEDGFRGELEEDGLKIKILEIHDRRLEKALVTLK
jgi:putative hemolysin